MFHVDSGRKSSPLAFVVPLVALFVVGGVMVVGTFAMSLLGVGTLAVSRVDYLGEDAARVPEWFSPHFGDDIQVAELWLVDAYALIRARVPDGFDSQMHGATGLARPEPWQADADAPTFALADLDLAAVPAMFASARGRVADVSSVHGIARPGPDGRPRWTVYVDGAREDLQLVYDAAGNPLEPAR